MPISKDKRITKDTIRLLQKLGATGSEELRGEVSRLPKIRDQIWSLPDSFKDYSTKEQELVIKGICYVEHWVGHHFAETPNRLLFGSTTVIPKLLRFIRLDRRQEITAWLLEHCTNPYIPFVGRH